MSEPINICYVISSITTGQAGSEGHLLRLIRNLDRTRFTPHLVILQETEWTKNFKQSGETDIPLTVLGFESFKKLSSWRAITKLASIFRSQKTKIVELYFTDAHFVGAIAAKLARVPVVISCRRNLGYQYGKKELKLSRLGNLFVTRFIANAKAVANHIASIEGIPRNKFTIIHNGIDLEKFDRAMERKIPTDFAQFIEGKKVVALSANLRPVKNVQGFLIAAYQLIATSSETVIVILGSGPDESSLQSLSAELGIADKVYWAGSVESPALYLAHADVCCLSSDSEGFSNSILEYMAAGKAVVATRVGGAGECIAAGESGFLVGRGDTDSLARYVSKLISDPQMCQSFGAAGRRIVEERFTLEAQMTQYHGLYESVIKMKS